MKAQPEIIPVLDDGCYAAIDQEVRRMREEMAKAFLIESDLLTAAEPVYFRGVPMRLMDAVLEDKERRAHPEWAGNDAQWWADYREALRGLG